MTLELFIAKKYLKAKRKEGFISLITFLSVAGVALGVMALVVVIAVMSGAETDFRKRILGFEPHMLVMSYGGGFDQYAPMLESFKKIPGTTDMSPILFGQAMIRTRGSLSGVMVRGIDPVAGAPLIQGYDADALSDLLSNPEPGSGLPGIILGESLARSVGVSTGDKVILMSARGIVSPLGQIPSMKRFMVVGTFRSGMTEYDSLLAYARLDQVQSLVGEKGKISAIGLWVNDVFGVKKIKDKYFSSLEYPFYIRDWMDINQSLFSALKLEKTAMFIILTLIILVAAFNIASALIMMVMEKTKDIAVLKAMGASNSLIQRIFMLQGMMIGCVGTLVGTIAGIVICWFLKKYDFIRLPEAYPFSTLPVQLEAGDVVIIAISALLICFVSTLYPARKAAGMDPVEAMRYG